MIIAYERVLKIKGGMVFVSDGKILSEIALTVGGVICETEMDVLSRQITQIQNQLVEHGVIHPNPLMSLLTLSLPVSPSLKISDKGLIDVETQTLTDLFL
jgi:adenine deaminase